VSETDRLFESETLPPALPESPWPTFRAWFDDAQRRRATPNPNAMALATADESGAPSVRIVLCKTVEPEAIVFYTNRRSRKGRELRARPRAAAVFHWDEAERQVRIEGPVSLVEDELSDRYFAGRTLVSRIGACASHQSEPIGSREELLDRVVRTMERLEVTPKDLLDGRDRPIERPAHWGGYRLHAERVELWLGGAGRVHDRAVWSRPVALGRDGPRLGEWTATRLQP